MEVVPTDVLLTILNKFVRDNVYTSLPGKVISVSNYQTEQTVDVVVDLARLYSDGKVLSHKGSVLYKVPFVNPSAGNAGLTLPVKVGDTVLLLFCMRNMETWLLGSGQEESIPNDSRAHHIKDAIAIPGLRQLGNGLSPHPDNLELKLGDCLIQLKPDGSINIEGSSLVTINGATVDTSGNVMTALGTDLDQLKADFEELKLHYSIHGSGAPSHPPGTP